MPTRDERVTPQRPDASPRPPTGGSTRQVGTDPHNYSPKKIAAFVSWVESLNARFARRGNKAVYDNGEFPWVRTLEANWRTIRDELDRVMEMKDRLPNFHDITDEVRPITTDDKWKTFFLAGYGIKSDRNAALCPQTTRLLREIPGMKTAFFSILAPNKHIPVHKGAYNGVLRYHLALKVPADWEKCRFWIEGQTMHWREGNSLIFDDTFEHAVDNDSNEFRAVLFVDFVRPIRMPFSLLNRFVLWLAPRTRILKEAREKHEAWEKTFYDTGADSESSDARPQ